MCYDIILLYIVPLLVIFLFVGAILYNRRMQIKQNTYDFNLDERSDRNLCVTFICLSLIPIMNIIVVGFIFILIGVWLVRELVIKLMEVGGGMNTNDEVYRVFTLTCKDYDEYWEQETQPICLSSAIKHKDRLNAIGRTAIIMVNVEDIKECLKP